MSIFYLMPPRPFVGDRLADFLQTYFPGLDWDMASRASLAETLGEAAAARTDVYVIYRDDLPRDGNCAQPRVRRGEAPGLRDHRRKG